MNSQCLANNAIHLIICIRYFLLMFNCNFLLLLLTTVLLTDLNILPNYPAEAIFICPKLVRKTPRFGKRNALFNIKPEADIVCKQFIQIVPFIKIVHKFNTNKANKTNEINVNVKSNINSEKDNLPTKLLPKTGSNSQKKHLQMGIVYGQPSEIEKVLLPAIDGRKHFVPVSTIADRYVKSNSNILIKPVKNQINASSKYGTWNRHFTPHPLMNNIRQAFFPYSI